MYKKLLSAAVALAITVFGVFNGMALAAPYGTGVYSDCLYSADCPAPPPSQPETTPPPPSVPEPAPNEPTTVVSISNIEPGDTIAQSPVDVIVSVDRFDNNNQPIGDDEIGWVSFYVDDQLVTTEYNVDPDGNYIISWDVVNFPGENLKAIAFDKDGKPIGEVELIVKLDNDLAEFAKNQQLNDQSGSGSNQKCPRPSCW
jgi:hypothetical protein